MVGVVWGRSNEDEGGIQPDHRRLCTKPDLRSLLSYKLQETKEIGSYHRRTKQLDKWLRRRRAGVVQGFLQEVECRTH